MIVTIYWSIKSQLNEHTHAEVKLKCISIIIAIFAVLNFTVINPLVYTDVYQWAGASRKTKIGFYALPKD